MTVKFWIDAFVESKLVTVRLVPTKFSIVADSTSNDVIVEEELTKLVIIPVWDNKESILPVVINASVAVKIPTVIPELERLVIFATVFDIDETLISSKTPLVAVIIPIVAAVPTRYVIEAEVISTLVIVADIPIILSIDPEITSKFWIVAIPLILILDGRRNGSKVPVNILEALIKRW